MVLREVVELHHWENGSGWSHSETFSNQLLEGDNSGLIENMNWDWWANEWKNSHEVEQWGDILIEVKFFDAGDTEYENCLAVHSRWESDLTS